MRALLLFIVAAPCSLALSASLVGRGAFVARTLPVLKPAAVRCTASGDGLYCLNVALYVKPERREEFIETIAANQRGTLTTEPLAVTYLWGEDEETPKCASNPMHLCCSVR